ncbi:het domain protein [Colletotrichum asianum]|uniref:Het domain protein n=1 Tax=Colletotrichum asianum TaxID=702518 RepID=A0A8H3WA51_9PEZI|nr:het domain protein [Colletotrichum asianum]
MPCDRCVEILNHTIKRAASVSEDHLSQTNTRALAESAKACRCCELLWDLFVKPALVHAKERFPSNEFNPCLPVGLDISSTKVQDDENRIHWATIRIAVEAEQQGRSFLKYGLIGVSIEDAIGNPGISDLIDSANLLERNVADLTVTEHRHPPFWTFGSTAPYLTPAEDRIRCAKAWLETCERDAHRECQPIEGLLPTRLIDVGLQTGILRLVHSDSLDEREGRVRYATLSHCWGLPGVQGRLKTTRQTVEAFCQEIPERSLPKTFRDAIRITKSLEIPYLWIDSLCILQDDPDEWQREASRMKDVYSGGVVTISATYGKNSSSGCLPEDESKMKVDIETKSSPSSTTNNNPVGHFLYNQRENVAGRQKSAHLSTRGWACQEQILSRRILYCLNSEIHWQCKRFYHTQSGQTFGGLESLGRGIDLIKSDHGEIWYKWIEDYTNREFTISSDRIPAFSGVTEYYQNITHQEVLLGVRRKSIAKDLSWVRIGSEKGPAGTRAPSWSWLSCNAPIYIDYWQRQEGDIEPQVCTDAVNCRIDWTGPAMTSAIQTTVFRVRGPVMKMAMRIAPESLHCNPPYFLVGQEESKGPMPWRCAGQFDHESHPGDEKTEYTCLLLFSRSREGGTRHKEVFLLLLPNTETECSFRRVGIAMMKGSDQTFLGAEERTLDLS